MADFENFLRHQFCGYGSIKSAKISTVKINTAQINFALSNVFGVAT